MDGPVLQPFLNVLRSLRHGAFYGTKIRAPHALVMIFLFRKGTLAEKLKLIIKLTYEHTKNLALFVAIYKAMLNFLRGLYLGCRLPMTSSEFGTPAVHWHALVAGAVGASVVWSPYSSVNYQIVMYLLSRVLIAGTKLASAKGLLPASASFDRVYPTLAMIVWALVMWLFEAHPEVLHPSLRRSMDFLYHESNSWPPRVPWDFLPSPATSAVCLASYLNWP